LNAVLNPRLLRAALPPLSMLVLVIAIWLVQPRAISYVGFNLMLNLALPIALATLAQLFIITVNDLDLSIGAFVSFCACVGATWLNEAPLLGVATLVGCIGVYAALGALIHLRIRRQPAGDRPRRVVATPDQGHHVCPGGPVRGPVRPRARRHDHVR
jgi:ribose transport system permease protein